MSAQFSEQQTTACCMRSCLDSHVAQPVSQCLLKTPPFTLPPCPLSFLPFSSVSTLSALTASVWHPDVLSYSLYVENVHSTKFATTALYLFRRRKVCLTLSGDIQGDSDEASASQILLKEVVTWAVPARMTNLGLIRSVHLATLPSAEMAAVCACLHVAKQTAQLNP